MGPEDPTKAPRAPIDTLDDPPETLQSSSKDPTAPKGALMGPEDPTAPKGALMDPEDPTKAPRAPNEDPIPPKSTQEHPR